MTRLINVLIFSTILISSIAWGQDIKFKVKGIKDTTVHLVKYVGSKMYYADTSALENGVVTFDGSRQDPGVMGLLMPGQRFFEFVYDGKPVYLETKSPNYREHMVIKESDENKLFYQYVNFMQDNTAKARKLSEEKASLGKDQKDRSAEIDKELNEMNKSVVAFQKKIAEENPETLVAKIVKTSTDVEVPDAPKNEDGSLKDSTFKYRYFRDHYFDNIDLTDSRIVNTPVFQKKLEYYYSRNMLLQHPDTLIKYLTPVVEQIPEGTQMYRFVVSNITSNYEKSKIMGMDKVVNYMVARYYCSPDKDGNPKAFWMDQEKMKDLCKDTQKRLRLVQGVVPPNLILPDSTNQKWYNLLDIDSEYTVLYFWDPNCGHCKKVTPKLQTLYEKKLRDRGVEIFAVGKATGDDFEDWKSFIKKHNLEFINVGLTQKIYEQAKEDPRSLIPSKTTLESINYQDTYDIFSTPRVWILDKDKKIIAKSLSIAQMERLFDRLQGKEDAEKLFELEEEGEEIEDSH
jgi:thiol-disulfide isomerase/thioredoxin